MLQWIRPENYRGISDICVEPLRRFNVIIGDNGVGKTSLLESIVLASSPNPASQFANISSFREFSRLRLGGDEAIRSLFRNLSYDEIPKIEYLKDDTKYTTYIEPLFGVSPKDDVTFRFPPPSTTDSAGRDEQSLSGLNFLSGVYPNQTSAERLLLTQDGYQINKTEFNIPSIPEQAKTGRVRKHKTTGNIFFIHARRATSIAETASVLTRLIEEKSDMHFLRAIQSVDNRVERIIPGSRSDGPMVLVDVGLPKLLPLNAMGDGFCRLVLIMTGTVHRHADTLIVDEIDSGLHHSVMANAWASLIDLSHRTDTQVFATTHSESMLKGMSKAFSAYPDDLSVIRLERDRNTQRLRARIFDYYSITHAMQSGFDIR